MTKKTLVSLGVLITLLVVSPAWAGTIVGSSSLIEALDYSDTFTLTEYGGNVERIDDTYPPSATAMLVESCYGNTQVSWPASAFAFVTDSSVNVGGSSYPGTSGSGSDTGITQAGGPLNIGFGIDYGLRDDFVIQFDAVQSDDRINIILDAATGSIGDGSLAIFIRAANESSCDIGVYSAGIGETDTGLSSGLAGTEVGQWHNYAAHFDLVNRELEVFIDENSCGTVDIDTLGEGIYSGLTFTGAQVSYGGTSSTRRFWSDNFQIGSAVEVPEPSTVALLLGMFASLAMFRRRK